jgi:hypothetical protein
LAIDYSKGIVVEKRFELGNAGFVPDPSPFDQIRHGAYFALSFDTFKWVSRQDRRIMTLQHEDGSTQTHQLCANTNNQDQKLRNAPTQGPI